MVCCLVNFIVIAALLLPRVVSFRVPVFRTLKVLGRSASKQQPGSKTALYLEQGETDDSSSSVADDQGKKIEEMMKLFVTAIDEGRQEDLVKAGLKVTTVSAKQALDEKLSDPEIIASILGPMASEEERSLKNELANQIVLEQELEFNGDRLFQIPGLDPSIFAELQAEAKETLEVCCTSIISFITPVQLYGIGSFLKCIRVGWALCNKSFSLFIVWVAFSAKQDNFDYSSVVD